MNLKSISIIVLTSALLVLSGVYLYATSTQAETPISEILQREMGINYENYTKSPETITLYKGELYRQSTEPNYIYSTYVSPTDAIIYVQTGEEKYVPSTMNVGDTLKFYYSDHWFIPPRHIYFYECWRYKIVKITGEEVTLTRDTQTLRSLDWCYDDGGF